MNVVFLSHIGAVGSGYKTLVIPLAQGLAEHGHKVVIIGLEYGGEQHDFDLTLVGAGNLQEAQGILLNLLHKQRVDVLIVALDIPVQVRLLLLFRGRFQGVLPFKYVGIFPVEADPLMFSWAMEIVNMNKRFVISQFGADECQKAGIDAEHIQIGIDTESWRVPSEAERQQYRESYGFDDDTFVVLTVADNQERKNLSRAMEIFSDFLYGIPNIEDEHQRRAKEGLPPVKPIRKAKYIMVTRERLSVGWTLRDYAQRLGLNPDFLIFERGLPFKKLWATYAVSDALLLTSKAEGLGLPLLEAMATDVHCIGTDCTAIAELLGDGRGTLIDSEYRHIDPFGNAHRYWCSRTDGVKKLIEVYETRDIDKTSKALEYVKKRTWDVAIKQLNDALEELK